GHRGPACQAHGHLPPPPPPPPSGGGSKTPCLPLPCTRGREHGHSPPPARRYRSPDASWPVGLRSGLKGEAFAEQARRPRRGPSLPRNHRPRPTPIGKTPAPITS